MKGFLRDLDQMTVSRPVIMQTNNKTLASKSSSTRSAIESAIALSKEDKTSTWEASAINVAPVAAPGSKALVYSPTDGVNPTPLDC